MKVSYLLAAVAILGLAGFAMAAKGAKGNKAPKTAALTGKITATAPDATPKTITVKAKTGEVVYNVVTATTITVDGAPSTVDKLAVGMMVTVTPPTGGDATAIDAKTAAAHKGGKKGK